MKITGWVHISQKYPYGMRFVSTKKEAEMLSKKGMDMYDDTLLRLFPIECISVMPFTADMGEDGVLILSLGAK